MNIVRYRHDVQLGGSLPHMRRPETQGRWDVFLKAVDGLPMTADELAIFAEHTNRTQPREGGYPESVLICGRQAGKDVTAADLVAHRIVRSLLTHDESADGTHAILVAQDMRATLRTCFRYASLAFDRIPMLARHVVGRTADSLTFDNGRALSTFACRPAAPRGLVADIVVCNELGHYRTSDGNPVDTEMLRAVRPCLATTGGKLIVLSSPYAQTGALWDLHRQHYGREDSPTLIWQASAPAMNPTLPADYLKRMEEDDPEAYRSEVLGEFRSGIATFLDPDALAACVADYRELLPAAAGVSYHAFADISGGARDASTIGIAHAEGERVVVDCVRAWPAPHSPDTVIGEAAALVATYHCREVVGDRYAGAFPGDAFARHGVRYVVSDLDRSSLYLELLPRILSASVQIPDDAALLRELRGLERRRGFAGRDKVDHRPGAHDDRSNALAGAVYVAWQAARRCIVVEPGGSESPSLWGRF